MLIIIKVISNNQISYSIKSVIWTKSKKFHEGSPNFQRWKPLLVFPKYRVDNKRQNFKCEPKSYAKTKLNQNWPPKKLEFNMFWIEICFHTVQSRPRMVRFGRVSVESKFEWNRAFVPPKPRLLCNM